MGLSLLGTVPIVHPRSILVSVQQLGASKLCGQPSTPSRQTTTGRFHVASKERPPLIPLHVWGAQRGSLTVIYGGGIKALT